MDTQDKKKYAIWYLEIDLADLWETLLEFCATSTYEEFISAVLALYPGASEECKWSMIDVDTLIGEHLHIGILTASDLAQYFCTYYTIMEFLKSKGRMSDLHRSKSHVCSRIPTGIMGHDQKLSCN
jgi:hypothetical protein